MRLIILGENGSTHVQKWISGLQKYSDINIHVITFNRGHKTEGVCYYYLKTFTNTKLDYLLNVFLVRKYVKSIHADLLHAHYATSYGFLAAFAGIKPFIITGWGADIFDSPKNVIMRKLITHCLNKASAVSVLSDVTLKEIKKLTAKKVHLIPFGVDVDRFHAVPKKNETFIIGTIRTLAEKYGVEYLIRAFADLSNKGEKNIELHIVGDGPLRSYLENLSSELSIKDKVFFHGFVNQNMDFERYYKILTSFDVFVIPSILDSETFGVAAVEASACSIPVIASNVGGLPEVIDNEKTGLIVSSKDSLQLAEAIEKLIKDKPLREKMGINGRQKVLEKYDWKKNVSQMIELYRSVNTN